jgi:thiol-disulfide isomerase/thioredoxin
MISLRPFLLLLACLCSETVFSQVRITEQCDSESLLLVGVRVGEKIYAKDTIESGSKGYNLDPGMYALVRGGTLVGDFLVTTFESEEIIVGCDSIVGVKSEVNQVFRGFIRSEDSLKVSVYDRAQGRAKQILEWCYPQLGLGRIPQSDYTNAGFNRFFCRYLSESQEFLSNTPFFELNLEYYFSKLVSQDSDTLIKYVKTLEDCLSGDSKLYFLRFALQRFESSKVLGHENVFIDVGIRTIVKGSTVFDSATDFGILNKAKQLYPNRIGTVVSDFKLYDPSGGSFQLFRSAPGLYKLLVFFDPDCHHCRESFPFITAFAQKFQDQGVEVYAVSTSLDSGELIKFAGEFGTPKNLSYSYDPNIKGQTFRDFYYLPSTPTLYLIRANGTCIARGVAASELESIFSHFALGMEQ